MSEQEKKYIADAEARGYKHGQWILSDAWPNTPLRVGFGLVWSENQQALVIGCTNENNSYFTAVPIYRPATEWWAEKIDNPLITKCASD